MNKNNLAGAMITSKSERSFDVYMYLLRLFDCVKGSKITVKYDDLAETLDIHEMKRVAYRRQIAKVLKKLDEEYNLIDLKTEFNKPATVTLMDYTGPTQHYSEPKSHYF